MTLQDKLNQAIWKGEEILEELERTRKRKDDYRRLYLRYKRRYEEAQEQLDRVPFVA